MMVTMSAPARIVKAAEFKAKCLELMDSVAESGGTIVITKRGKPVAQLSPVVSRPATLLGYKSEQIEFVGDVVAPVEVQWGPESPRKRRPVRPRRRP
jgi:prevent-host-death family protein